jgi:hypothetical protein
MPLALSDRQLQLVIAAAQPLSPDKRVLLLERVAAQLRFTVGGRRGSPMPMWPRVLDRAIRGLVTGSAA